MLKKIIACIMAAVLCLAAGGCAGAEQTPKQVAEKFTNSSYTTTAVIEYKGIKANVQLLKSEGRCKVTFESPDSLKDLSFDYTGDLVTVVYGKLQFSVTPDSMPAKALSTLLINSLNKSLSGQGISIEQQGGKVKITGQSEGTSFELILDRENGNALSLNIPAEELKIDFHNFSFLD